RRWEAWFQSPPARCCSCSARVYFCVVEVRLRLMLATLAIFCALLASPDPITVDKRPPTTQYVDFDPAHPPADVEKLQHGEDALTRMLFNCSVKLKYTVLSKTHRDGKWRVVAELGEVKLTLDLKN